MKAIGYLLAGAALLTGALGQVSPVSGFHNHAGVLKLGILLYPFVSWSTRFHDEDDLRAHTTERYQDEEGWITDDHGRSAPTVLPKRWLACAMWNKSLGSIEIRKQDFAGRAARSLRRLVGMADGRISPKAFVGNLLGAD